MLSIQGNIAGVGIDQEYLRIIQELQKLGLKPTGNKSTDTSRLADAKAQLIERIQSQNNAENNQALGIQTLSPVEEIENVQKSEMEEQRLGAMTIAELNKLYFGL